jgi:serine/threonine-protein kinase
MAGSGCNAAAKSEAVNRAEPPARSDPIADRPPTAKTLYVLAEILAKQGRDAECETILKRVITDHPTFVPAYNSLAELHMRQRKIKNAIEVLSAGLEISPQDPVLLNNLGMCQLIRKDFENALELFTFAAGLKPENARYRANAAVACGILGREAEALALFEQILPHEQAVHNVEILRTARQHPDIMPTLIGERTRFEPAPLEENAPGN